MLLFTQIMIFNPSDFLHIPHYVYINHKIKIHHIHRFVCGNRFQSTIQSNYQKSTLDYGVRAKGCEIQFFFAAFFLRETNKMGKR